MKDILQIIKRVDKKTWYIWSEIAVLFSICMLHGISAGRYANFVPMNGSFQNYNPVRRLLAGQIPYRDFQDYLGIGHLYVGAICTFLLGRGNFRGSLMAFSFLTIFCFALLCLMIGYSVLGNKLSAVTFANIIVILLITRPQFIEGVVSEFELTNALAAGNSARYVRGMVLPISCILIHAVCAVHQYVCGKMGFIWNDFIKLCGIGFLAGFSFIWSNDYGISCWLCLLIMTFVTDFSRVRRLGKALLGVAITLGVSLISIFLCVEIFTLGHFREWFSVTFGTGGYQSWYYNSSKSFYMFQVDFSYIMLVQAFLCLVYLGKLYMNRGTRAALFRYGIPAFCNMTAFCAVNEYHLLSGGNAREVALAILFITLMCELCRCLAALFSKEKERNVLGTMVLVAGLAWIGAALVDEIIFWGNSGQDGEYVEAMGGNMTFLYGDLKDTSEFLNGERFFSTYASAQEVVEDTFQPSGTDYIIHVLGGSQREDYLTSFKNENFKYTATIKETYTDLEYWVQRANWFFYRELYRNWHPVYANSYELYWVRNEENETNTLIDSCVISVQYIDEATKKIIVSADTNINGIADVYIDYEVKKKNTNLARLLFTTMLKVENTGALFANDSYWESNYLRSCNAEYIPIPIVNGYGEVTLTSSPAQSTYLELNGVNCSDIYRNAFDYIEINAINNVENEILIYSDNNGRNKKVLANIVSVVIGDEIYPVSEVREDGNDLQIIILTNGDIGQLQEIVQNNNVLRIVR